MIKVPGKAIWRQIMALIPVYLNGLMMGCASGWLPNAIYFLLAGKEVHATTSQTILIVSFYQFGKIIFAIPAGILADKYGRKKIILGVAFLVFVISSVLSWDTSLNIIYIGRFAIGIAEVLWNTTAIISIGEIASPEIRGTLTNLYQIFKNTGLIIPSIVSVIFSSYKLLTCSLTLISLISLLSMFWVTETPSFLVKTSEPEKAKNNLQRIRRGYQQNEITNEYEKLKKYIEDEKTRKSESSWLKFLKSKPIRKPLLIGILLNSFASLTGAFFIRAYVTVIIPSNEFVSRKYYPLIHQILILFISTMPTFYIDRFPRRTIFLFGAASMILINALCAVSNFFMVEYRSSYIFKWIFLLGNILIMLGCGALIKPMVNAINSELYPQTVKGFCVSIMNMSQGISLIVSYQFYNFIHHYHRNYLMYGVFLVSSIMLCIVIYFYLPESGGASLSDFQMKFKKESVKGDGINVEKKDRN